MAVFKNLLKKVGLPYDDVSFILNKIVIAHMIPGRIRVVYKELCKNDAIYTTIYERLSELKDIKNFSINRITGSVIIEYESKNVEKTSFLGRFLEGASVKYKQEK